MGTGGGGGERIAPGQYTLRIKIQLLGEISLELFQPFKIVHNVDPGPVLRVRKVKGKPGRQQVCGGENGANLRKGEV